MLLIAALAVPIGALDACAAWVLSHLIALITNLVRYQRFGADPVYIGAVHHHPLLIIGAPVLGGMVSLTMLLAGRVRDHHEEHTAQRFLRLPTIRPSRVEVGATA